MERDYDLFEVLADGALIWRETVPGHGNAIRKLIELSKQTASEVRMMHVLSNTLIASMNGPKP
jgi:prophage DNA circulation protein